MASMLHSWINRSSLPRVAIVCRVSRFRGLSRTALAKYWVAVTRVLDDGLAVWAGGTVWAGEAGDGLMAWGGGVAIGEGAAGATTGLFGGATMTTSTAAGG